MDSEGKVFTIFIVAMVSLMAALLFGVQAFIAGCVAVSVIALAPRP